MDVFNDILQRTSEAMWRELDKLLAEWLKNEGAQFVLVHGGSVGCAASVSISSMRRRSTNSTTADATAVDMKWPDLRCMPCHLAGKYAACLQVLVRRPIGARDVDRVMVMCQNQAECEHASGGRAVLRKFDAVECAVMDSDALWEAAEAYVAAMNHPRVQSAIVDISDDADSPVSTPPASPLAPSPSPSPPPTPKKPVVALKKPQPPAKKPATPKKALAPKKPPAPAPKKPPAPPAPKPVEAKRPAEAELPAAKRAAHNDGDERMMALFSTVSALLHDDSEKMAFRMIARIGITHALTPVQAALLRSAYARWIAPDSLASAVLDAYVASADDTPIVRWTRLNAAACKHF